MARQDGTILQALTASQRTLWKDNKPLVFLFGNHWFWIWKPNVNVNVNVNDNVLKENTLKGVKEKRFAPPTLENVSEYCREMGYTNVDAARFIDFYTSNGWMVGKNRMKDWKAAVRNWDRREKNPQRQDGAAEVSKKNRFHNLEEHGYD